MLEELVYIRWNAMVGAYNRKIDEFVREMPAAKG
jgi:dolichyl-phosphate beta-glucosyltransferase